MEITLRHGCSAVNLLHIFRTPFFKRTTVWLLLNVCTADFYQVFAYWESLSQLFKQVMLLANRKSKFGFDVKVMANKKKHEKKHKKENKGKKSRIKK